MSRVTCDSACESWLPKGEGTERSKNARQILDYTKYELLTTESCLRQQQGRRKGIMSGLAKGEPWLTSLSQKQLACPLSIGKQSGD